IRRRAERPSPTARHPTPSLLRPACRPCRTAPRPGPACPVGILPQGARARRAPTISTVRAGPVMRTGGCSHKVVCRRRGGSMLRGFKDFIMRGNVIDLAVGIVIGAAFTAVVTGFTNSLINPIIHRVGGGGEFGGKVKIGGGQVLDWGAFINAVITFLITAAVLYFFFVLPMNKLEE